MVQIVYKGMRMKYQEYNTRRQQRYQTSQTPSIGKKLIEQFLTQVVVCVLLVMVIIGAQLLGFKQIDSGMYRMKMAIVYSPSLDEMTQKAKNVMAIIMERVNQKEQNQEITPVISIDNDVL